MAQFFERGCGEGVDDNHHQRWRVDIRQLAFLTGIRTTLYVSSLRGEMTDQGYYRGRFESFYGLAGTWYVEGEFAQRGTADQQERYRT